jgi:recombination protein RecA
MYGDPETTSGGRAWKHACSTMVNFAAQIQKDNLIKDEATGETVGHKVKIKVEKNKCAPPNKECEFDIKYVDGIVNRHLEIGALAIKYNVVERPNNVMYEYDDRKWKGRDNFLQALELDEELQNNLLKTIEKIQEMNRQKIESEEDE